MTEGQAAAIVIARLEEENERLRQRLSRLERETKIDVVVFPYSWGLVHQESVILSTLYKRERVESSVLRDSVPVYWAEKIENRGRLSVPLFRLRRKISPFGVEIRTLWGFGYMIEPEHKAIIRQAIEAAQ